MASAQSFTLAVSNNRYHMLRSLCYCLFAPHLYGCCSSRTFCLWWTADSAQQQWRGCNNIPSFLQRTAPIACSFCEVCTWHDLHILVTAPFCCHWKSWAASAQSFTLWQQATIEITCRDHFIVTCSHHIYCIWLLFFAHIPFMVKCAFSATQADRLQQHYCMCNWKKYNS